MGELIIAILVLAILTKIREVSAILIGIIAMIVTNNPLIGFISGIVLYLILVWFFPDKES